VKTDFIATKKKKKKKKKNDTGHTIRELFFSHYFPAFSRNQTEPKENLKRDRERKCRCLKDFGTENMGGLAIAEKGRVG
jgi:hypothetical protein